ncbi:MAG: undecaprenyl-diphosphate phosphatase, partial [Gemmiger sp.]
MNLFVEILKSIVYGVIEGITEWLPISSTGHMILAEQVLHFQLSNDFMEMFRVVIQLGAILAVVVLYFRKLWPFCRDNGRDSGL